MTISRNERRKSSALIGKRVQVPVYTDTWMKGDRFGTVRAVTMHRESNIVHAHVEMDKSKKRKQFVADDCEIIGD